MGILKMGHIFLSQYPLLAIVLTMVVLSWLVGKRVKHWQSLQERVPLLLAMTELFLAPLAVVLVFAVVMNLLGGSSVLAFDRWFPILFRLILCLVVGWYAARAVHAYLAGRYIGELRSHPQPVPGLLHGSIYGAGLLVGAGIFFLVQGYSLTGVWISTGLATALIGFALQQTLADFFSGVALSLEGAFRIGDWLRLENGTEGQIVDINWRATWLKGWDDTTHVIPNARLAAQGFKNLHGEYHLYRPWYYVKIPAEVDPRFAKELLLEAVYNCKYILKSPAPIVRLTDASSLPYTYMVWVHFPNYPAMFRGREELYREIHYVLQRAGVTPAAEVREWRARRAEIPTAEPSTIQIALKSQDLFAGLSDEEIDRIAQASQQLHYDAGSTILLEGDNRDALDVVSSGVVDSSIRLPSGDLLQAGEFLAGQYFGLITMFTDHPSLFEYTARTDVTLIRVDMDCMREVLKEHPDLADYYAAIIKQRLDEADLLCMADSPADSRPTTLQEIKHFIRHLIASGKP